MPEFLPKASLKAGAYYVGKCRNASIARWDGTQFHHWRVKFQSRFLETIKHREDEEVFDVFDAWRTAREDEVAEIPLPPIEVNS